MAQLMLGLAPFLLVTLAVWSVIMTTPITRRALLHREPFSLARWDFLDILLAVGLYFTCNALVFLVASGWLLLTDSIASGELATMKPPETMTALFVLAPIATLLAVLTSTFAIKWRTGQSLSHLGWSLKRFPRDARLALAATFLTLPLVYFIQAFITSLPGMQYEHPTMKILEGAKSPGTWFAIGFTVIIVAPISEEFFFRSIIQGWIEKMVQRLHRQGSDQLPTDDPSPAAAGEAGIFDNGDPPAGPSPIKMSWLHRMAPIFLTSFLFSAAHWNHGGGWVALLFFSFSLGFLYHKTHRLLPCILLHMALNTVSLVAFYLVMHYRPHEMAS